MDHWRALAADALERALKATDPECRAMLVSMAALYEDLALRAERTDPAKEQVSAMSTNKADR
jgi:hypothetical protein